MTGPDIAQRVREIVACHADIEGALLPVLHAIQEDFRHIPDAAVPVLADALCLSAAEIRGVISFYTDFHDHPTGKRRLRVCRAEACQAMGAAALGDTLRARLGIDWEGTTTDGAVTLEPAYCLGLCACAPAALVDDTPVGRATADRLLTMVAESAT
ncbi:NAD-dependent formate dehydrogenase gamma subunit [Rhodovulum sp. P5]|uniref:formate dehydrogenase subunit gamma n=1 Tax=Rhodovulum sp. P5 TaxID=1564506 RepID=UPI0009C33117|nr:formate dehydrogenase subunit gamma [Rhodovulum sp. P5]ARE41649.1 NAD-dependent formate dehydrogenase gamma subunit [Rhodovulum sp. P5]